MEKRYYLGIDVGTFSSRGILLDEDFHLVADESVPHGMDNPAPGYFEHDALGVWWADFCKLSRVLLQRSGISPRQIACVGASALGTVTSYRPLSVAACTRTVSSFSMRTESMPKRTGPGTVLK